MDGVKRVSGRQERERGSVAVEFALVLPMLCLLVIGGWVLGYMAYAKVALAMAANRAARDFAAATEQHKALQEVNQAYRYDGSFAESFGLPRWGVHALIMKTKVGNGGRASDHAVTVATCYRLPLSVPFMGGGEEAVTPGPVGEGAVTAADVEALLERTAADRRAGRASEGLTSLANSAPAGRSVRLNQAADPTALLGEEELEWLAEQAGIDYRRLLDEAAFEAAEWERLLEEGKGLYERGEEILARGGWAAELFKQLLEGPPADLTPFYGDGTDSPEGLETAVRSLCEPPEGVRGRSVVVTARSAYLLQEIFEPEGGEP